MPLLPLEPFLFPEGLLGPSPVEGIGEGAWWAIHARPRAEKTLARKLLTARVPFFLPLYRKEWHSRGRTQASYLPLFPGYLFLHGGDEARLAALQTNYVVQLLPVPDSARLKTDLARVYRVMGGEVPALPEDRLRVGTPVRVVSGPLAGLEGTVLRVGKRFRLLIEVQFLQRGVSVEVTDDMIEPLVGCAATQEQVEVIER